MPKLSICFSGWSETEAAPVSPEPVVDVAFELPDVALASGFASALPELPVLPDVALGFAVESPDVAVPVADDWD
jgi:hypothetical protein